jgi:hypothetical protein
VLTLRSVAMTVGLSCMVASGGAAHATECCVLNPNLRLHLQSDDCVVENNIYKCPQIEKLTGNKPNLLSFLHDEVGGGPFPSGAFVYVCPIDPDEGPIPTTNRSFVRDKSGFSVDVTQHLKFLVYFNQLIFQGTFDTVTSAEKSKDEFPMELQINGVVGGTTNIRLVGYGHESFNAKAIADDNTQQVSASVKGNVVGDPGNSNTFKGDPVLVEGNPVCVTKETFDRD